MTSQVTSRRTTRSQSREVSPTSPSIPYEEYVSYETSKKKVTKSRRKQSTTPGIIVGDNSAIQEYNEEASGKDFDDDHKNNSHLLATQNRSIRPILQRRVRILLGRLTFVLPVLPLTMIITACFLALALPLPRKPFQRMVYVDENALQPGAATVHWGWNDVQYADQIADRVLSVASKSSEARAAFLTNELKVLGFSPHNQSYIFEVPCKNPAPRAAGINTYARWPSARGDGREAFVISANWLSSWDGSNDPDAVYDKTSSSALDGTKTDYDCRKDRRTNIRGIATALAVARYLVGFKQWSKDLIFVFADGEIEGMQAWTSGYFGREQRNLHATPVQGRGAVIWNALALDYPSDSFSHLQIKHEGIDGQLPNLDMISTLAQLMHRAHNVPLRLPASSEEELANQQFGPIDKLLQNAAGVDGKSIRQYISGSINIIRQVALLSVGLPTGAHGTFHRYHVDAITIFAYPAKGPFGFYNMGKVVESMTRSMSNLLERLHHSHFFYLLTDPYRFVEVAKYLPLALLFCASLMLAGITSWWQEGITAEKRQENIISLMQTSLEEEGLNLRFTSLGDTNLQHQTQAQRTASFIDLVVEFSAHCGNLVGTERIRQLASLIDLQSRPLLEALKIAAYFHTVGLVYFFVAHKIPVDCAKDGLFSCKPLRLASLIVIVSVSFGTYWAAKAQEAKFVARTRQVSQLLPKRFQIDMCKTHSSPNLSLARTLFAITLMEGAILTLAVSIVNFSLAFAFGAILNFGLYYLSLPHLDSTSRASEDKVERASSPMSNDSDTVELMLRSVSPQGINRARFCIQGLILLSLTPTFALYNAKSTLQAIQSYGYSFLQKEIASVDSRTHNGVTSFLARLLIDDSIVERLLDDILWNYQVFSSQFVPLICITFLPIILMAATSQFLVAFSR